jgi:hypothetical protein
MIIATKMRITTKTRATQKTTPTALTHMTPTVSLRPVLHQPDAAPLDSKTTANSAPYQHKSDSATYPSLPLPMYRRVGILAIIHERSNESLMQEAEYQEIMLCRRLNQGF